MVDREETRGLGAEKTVLGLTMRTEEKRAFKTEGITIKEKERAGEQFRTVD